MLHSVAVQVFQHSSLNSDFDYTIDTTQAKLSLDIESISRDQLKVEIEAVFCAC